MSQPESLRSARWKPVVLLVVAAVLVVALAALLWWLYAAAPSDEIDWQRAIPTFAMIAAALAVFAVVAWLIIHGHIGNWSAALQTAWWRGQSSLPVEGAGEEIASVMREQFGLFWRHRVRLLWVLGEADQVDLLVPGLAEKRWLHDQNTVLLWLGSSQSPAVAERLERWRALRAWRPVDGFIWVLSEGQRDTADFVATGTRFLQNVMRTLRWQAPLHLWQLSATEWEQAQRPQQTVGRVFPARADAAKFQACLREALPPLRRLGLAQMHSLPSHDFLWRLARGLQAEGITRWAQALVPLFERRKPVVALRGIWFSPLPHERVQTASERTWAFSPAWAGVLADRARGRRLGWSVPRVLYASLMLAACVWGIGLLLSFVSNRTMVAQAQQTLTVMQQAQGGDEQLLALHEVVRELARLRQRSVDGVPWYQRWGLSRNADLLAAFWPRYVDANNRLLRDPLAASLHGQMTALLALPPQSPERSARAAQAYDQLKAYLMMARAERSEADFLAATLVLEIPMHNDVQPGRWQGLSASLLRFYATQLAAHPDWRIEPDRRLIAQVRQVLLGQLGQRNAESNLYQQVLDEAANNYPALGVEQLTSEADVQPLFASSVTVPGEFTRQAWEGQVRQAIEQAAEARREKVDWVLSETPADLMPELTPEQLKHRLTARYFQDYSSAWLRFLNSLQWQRANGLADVIDQLTLMSDVRQSPLIALLNSVAYQGQAGGRTTALTDTLIDSAQKLLANTPAAAINQHLPGADGPLHGTFGPLLKLLGKQDEPDAGQQLSIQAFLNRVTRVRLTLQQITAAQDPQHMTQALAQTVFQGKGVDLTDTRAYGNLMAASLGGEWAGIGQTLFVQPLEQAWQQVLEPSANALNRQWQRTIVDLWDKSFTGRYPFAATASTASLPMLGQMIRADSGRIEQFLQQQLAGVLRKEGTRWVVDPSHSQGLVFNPAFLAAVEQLSELADVLFTDGGMGLSFELMAKPVQGVAQTLFILDGQRLHYFNQKESWQRFTWPGNGEYPGASLTWTSMDGGERLFGDFQGPWGLIRLLELAQATPLDDGESRYRLQLETPDDLQLTWHLRSELHAGPLALLRLRGFRLPTQIFLPARAAADDEQERL